MTRPQYISIYKAPGKLSSQYKITRQEAVQHDQQSVDITNNRIKPLRISDNRIIGYVL